MKKFNMIIVVLCLTLLIGCSRNTATPSDPTVEKTVKLLQDMPNAEKSMTSDESDNQVKQASSADLEEYFSLPEVEVFIKLGTKYELLMIPDEKIVWGSYFSKLGLIFVFDEQGPSDMTEAPLEFIICDKDFIINGASREMNFEQIQEKLGKVKVEKVPYEASDKKVYEITYVIDGFKYKFFSFDKAGTDPYLTIQKAT